VINVHATKAFRGSRETVYSILSLLLDGDERSTSHPETSFDDLEKRKISCSCSIQTPDHLVPSIVELQMLLTV